YLRAKGLETKYIMSTLSSPCRSQFSLRSIHPFDSSIWSRAIRDVSLSPFRAISRRYPFFFPWDLLKGAEGIVVSGVKMIGSFITGSLALILGYAYPAYECFKTVELNKPDIEQLLFWCQYWCIFIYGQGTTYVYETFFRPYVAKHENDIDRNLLELRTRAGDIVVLNLQKVASYGQTRIFEILQYVASQSPSQSSRTRPVQVLTVQAK
ncbi:hypothetical protein BHE74_00054444, partial [Ensete ventricosum]